MVKTIARRITGIIGRLSSYSLLLAGVMIVIMVFTATYGVVRRYAFNSPEPYSYEISMMFLVFSFVLAVPTVERLSQHIRVDLVSNMLPKKVQHIILAVLTPLMGLAFITILVYKGFESAFYAFDMGERSMSAWRQPLGPLKLMIPIGYSILWLVLAVKLVSGVARLRGALTGKETPSDAFAPSEKKQGAE